MKIVMLNGQNHKGSTYRIGRMIAERIAGENEIEEFFFPGDLDHFCAGCYACIEDVAACPFYPEKKRVIDAMDAADVLIVTTPTYCLHMSAPLKSFFDLTFDMWMPHRPMKSMFRKRAVIVSTSAGASTRSAIRDVRDALFYMGVPKIIGRGFKVQAMSWEGVPAKIKAKIDKAAGTAAAALSAPGTPRVGLRTRAVFKMMSMIHAKGWNSSPVETQYWRDNGWLDGGRPWKD